MNYELAWTLFNLKRIQPDLSNSSSQSSHSWHMLSQYYTNLLKHSQNFMRKQLLSFAMQPNNKGFIRGSLVVVLLVQVNEETEVALGLGVLHTSILSSAAGYWTNSVESV